MLGEQFGRLLLVFRGGSKLHDAEVVLETAIWTSPDTALPAVATNPGEVLVYLRSATVSFAADGEISGCTPGESFGIKAFRPDPCAHPSQLVLQQDLKPGTVARPVRMRWAVYLKNEPNASLTPR